MLVLIIINAIAGIGSAGMGAVAVVRPQLFSQSESSSTGETLYARMYAARAIPFGLAAALAPFWWSGPTVVILLVAAAAAQVIDIMLSLKSRLTGMIIGATVAATVHVVAAIAIGTIGAA
ncbi:MAG: hypothetical protein LBV06_07530 [Propionibacteriaceae bacterium]|jgi:hypothetical protein|nr:hypothetical protein [Propionibacteriaceae bacterium]